MESSLSSKIYYFIIHSSLCDILGSHSRDYVDDCVLGYLTVWFGRYY
jgi:hypothetical protein